MTMGGQMLRSTIRKFYHTACNAKSSFIFMDGVHILHNDCLLCTHDKECLRLPQAFRPCIKGQGKTCLKSALRLVHVTRTSLSFLI